MTFFSLLFVIKRSNDTAVKLKVKIVTSLTGQLSMSAVNVAALVHGLHYTAMAEKI
jgi:hypothetical protein